MKENAMKLLNKTIRNEMGANAKKLLKEKFSISVASEQIIFKVNVKKDV